MKLTTVLSAVNNNPSYYKFIPKQILFWRAYGIKFVAVFVGESLPPELEECRANIFMWSKNLDLNTAYVGQNLRLFYPALLQLPEDEFVMITDMDMLPTVSSYFKDGLEQYTQKDFIYYRKVEGNQILMCYNAAHPSTWSTVFGVRTEQDVEAKLYQFYNGNYTGVPGGAGWFTDQIILYAMLIPYPHLKVLDRPLKRLEMWDFNAGTDIRNYHDAHFHRSYADNEQRILMAEAQMRANGLL